MHELLISRFLCSLWYFKYHYNYFQWLQTWQQSCLWAFLQPVPGPDVFCWSKGLLLLDQNETPLTMTLTSGSVLWVSLLLFKISLHFLCQSFFEFHGDHIKEYWMAQWWEHLPPTNVAWVQILAMMLFCGLSLLLVFSFALRRFSLGTPVFPSPQKSTFPNSNLIRNQVEKEWLCGCTTSKSLFTYL